MAKTIVWSLGCEMGSVPSIPNFMSYTSYIGAGGSPHTGTYSLQYSIGAIAAQTIYFNVMLNTAQGLNLTLDEIYVSFWISGRGNNQTKVYIYLTDGNYVVLDIQANPSVIYLNGTPVATGTVTVGGGWNHYQIHYKAADADGKIEFKVNGVTDGSYTGDTKPASSSTIAYVQFYSVIASNTTFYWDDLAIGTGEWLGDVRCSKLSPNSDVTTQFYKSGISFQTPAAAGPTTAVGAATGLTGTYKYKVTIVDPDGETLASPESSPVTVANQKVNLSDIALGVSGSTQRKIYRTVNGGSTFKLLTTIADNTTTTYVDSTADGSLGADEPASTPLYDKVNEVGPNDSTYVYSKTNGHQAKYNLADWDSLQKTPLAVCHWERLYKNTAGGQQAKLLATVGGSTTTSSAVDIPPSAQYILQVLSAKPGGGDWTAADINNLQIGVEAVIP